MKYFQSINAIDKTQIATCVQELERLVKKTGAETVSQVDGR